MSFRSRYFSLKEFARKTAALFRTFFSSDIRRSLAGKYLRGEGLEIGALHLPLALPRGARAKYVDRLDIKELRVQYPELKKLKLVNPDIIDDGETLAGVDSESQDFLIANHFLEHCENPIGAVKTFLRVVKKKGVIYMAVPDKRFTFDSERPVTTLGHLVNDYVQGATRARGEHLKEWGRLVDRHFSNDAERDLSQLKRADYSIHFHTWTCLELFELLVYLKRELSFEFEIEEFVFSRGEALFILRKGNAVRS